MAIQALHATGVPFQITPISGVATNAGNTTCITPASGKSLRIFYISYNPLLAVEAAFRWGLTGNLWLWNSLATGTVVIAKDFGTHHYLQGAIDEPLVIWLSGAVSTIWNAFYIET
jgi:hypothetical protein